MARALVAGLLSGAGLFALAGFAQLFTEWLQVAAAPAVLVLSLGIPSSGWAWVMGVAILVVAVPAAALLRGRRTTWLTAAATVVVLAVAGTVIGGLVPSEEDARGGFLVALLTAGARTLFTWAAAGLFIGFALRRRRQ